MKAKIFAEITIRFPHDVTEQNLEEIVSKLREFEEVGSFATGANEMSFQIRGDTEVNYGIIAKLQELCKKKCKDKPQITAVEYVKSGERSF